MLDMRYFLHRVIKYYYLKLLWTNPILSLGWSFSLGSNKWVFIKKKTTNKIDESPLKMHSSGGFLGCWVLELGRLWVGIFP